MTSAQQMKMDVSYGLAGVLVAVDHDPVSRFGDPFVRGDLLRREKDPAHEIRVRIGQVVQSRDMLPRDDKDVDGRGRVKVLKRDQALVGIDDVRLDLARRDPAKRTFAHFRLPFRISLLPNEQQTDSRLSGTGVSQYNIDSGKCLYRRSS